MLSENQEALFTSLFPAPLARLETVRFLTRAHAHELTGWGRIGRG